MRKTTDAIASITEILSGYFTETQVRQFIEKMKQDIERNAIKLFIRETDPLYEFIFNQMRKSMRVPKG